MKEIVYWIPVRTIGGTERDKVCICSKCENQINLGRMTNEEQRKYFTRCEECNAEMDMYVTYEIIKRGFALGDRGLKEYVSILIHEVADEMNSPEKQETDIKKEKPVTKVIAEVREKMCADYCKFPQIYDPDEWEEIAEEVCTGCPLDRL